MKKLFAPMLALACLGLNGMEDDKLTNLNEKSLLLQKPDVENSQDWNDVHELALHYLHKRNRGFFRKNYGKITAGSITTVLTTAAGVGGYFLSKLWQPVLDQCKQAITECQKCQADVNNVLTQIPKVENVTKVFEGYWPTIEQYANTVQNYWPVAQGWADKIENYWPTVLRYVSPVEQVGKVAEMVIPWVPKVTPVVQKVINQCGVQEAMFVAAATTAFDLCCPESTSNNPYNTLFPMSPNNFTGMPPL